MDDTDQPAPAWSMTQYSLMVVEHLTGAGEPMPSHDAFRVFLVFWLMYSLIIGGKATSFGCIFLLQSQVV
jgi:hypothetical protein